MALQTGVVFNQAIGQPGSIDATNNYTINPYFAGDGADGEVGLPSGLYAGLAAFNDFSDPTGQTVIPGKTGSVLAEFAGIVARNAYTENDIDNANTILNGGRIGVLNNGQIFAITHVAMEFGEPVHLIINDADPTNIGKLTNAVVSADVIDISSRVVLTASTTGANELVKVRVANL
jgi:hypothetical protein